MPCTKSIVPCGIDPAEIARDDRVALLEKRIGISARRGASVTERASRAAAKEPVRE
jgi:hypothetical protein